MNLVQLLASSVQVHGDKACLRYVQDGTYKEISYTDFWNEITAFAQGLHDLGVKPNSRVVILSENRPEWAISDFAILLLRAVVVPIYPTLPARQVRFILQNSDAAFVIVEDTRQLAKVCETQVPLQNVIVMDRYPRFTHADADESDAAIVATQQPSSSQSAQYQEGTLPPFQLNSFSEVVAMGPPSSEEKAEWLDFQNISADQLATIVHTSGTSGVPKGVMLSHGNIVSNVEASLKMLPVSSDDVGLSYLPLSHVFERTVGQFAALSVGATIAYAESIEKIQDNLQQVRPTFLVTVPRLLEKVYARVQDQILAKPGWLQSILRKPVETESRSGTTYRLVDILVFRKIRKGLGNRMKLVVSGGAALSPEIGKFYAIAGVPVYEGYGMTESAPVIAVNPLGEARFGTVGKPLSNVEVRIANDGELLIKGPNVMQGYINAPEETAKVLMDGWLHTGDVAEIDDGYIRIVDRMKNILVLATGKNVSPAPIENAIALAPHISAAVVVGEGRKYVTVLVVPDFETMAPFLNDHGIASEPHVWVDDPRVTTLIQREVTAAIEPFAGFERPKRALLLPTEWTVDSGELTPTLKVRSKIVLKNYADDIDAMYAGKRYIPLGETIVTPTEPETSPDDNSLSTTPHQSDGQSPPLQTRTKHKRRPAWIVRGSAALAVLCVIGLASLLMHPPQAFNLNGMIKSIGKRNNDINHQNKNIVSAMKSIQNSSAATPVIASQLGQLKGGVVQSDGSLQQLDTLSQQEVGLSKSFRSLATSMNGDLYSIKQSSSQQKLALSHMATSTHEIDTTSAQLKSLQNTISGKLAKAAAASQKIANEMP